MTKFNTCLVGGIVKKVTCSGEEFFREHSLRKPLFTGFSRVTMSLNFENASYGGTRNFHVLLIRHAANVCYRVEIGAEQSYGNRVATVPSRKTRPRQIISVPALFNWCVLFIQESVLTIGVHGHIPRPDRKYER